jgi:hypothetical protein
LTFTTHLVLEESVLSASEATEVPSATAFPGAAANVSDEATKAPAARMLKLRFMISPLRRRASVRDTTHLSQPAEIVSGFRWFRRRILAFSAVNI